MRLTKAQFCGYKRLADTSCNVDGKLIAFLGPNEAGKSSVLEALEWLSNGDPLVLANRSRSLDVSDDDTVVRTTFVLEETDREALSQLCLEQDPITFTWAKTAGSRNLVDITPDPKWHSGPFRVAANLLEPLEKETGEAGIATWERLEDQSGIGDTLDCVVELLESARDRGWNTDEQEGVNRLIRFIRELDASKDEESGGCEEITHLQEVVIALNSVLEIVALGDPEKLVLDALWERRPRFVLFTEGDRFLQTSYALHDESLRNTPPAALANLLKLGGTSTHDLFSILSSGDKTRIKTKLRQVNETLKQRIRPAWRQAELTIEIANESTVIDILVNELHKNGSTTVIDERSDGLKTFIALISFLEEKKSVRPPILLIDEAETHLHYNAQSDLINVLLGQEEAKQVLYTTHSPGCLPPDLGTGVRFVSPSPDNNQVSHLKNNFWLSGVSGFSPLLFAMGASVAAFSACRQAVIAEGATEMILLPTMIRRATGDSEIPYQVAPGLSNVSAADASLQDVATRVAYLVDGDSGGRTKKKQLERAGVPTDKILSLPPGKAIEDLLTATCYLQAVNAHLAEIGYAGSPIVEDDIDPSVPITRSVQTWCEARGVSTPGKTAVASRLVWNPDSIELSELGKETLEDLHVTLTQILA